jgi:hypothetical protein
MWHSISKNSIKGQNWTSDLLWLVLSVRTNLMHSLLGTTNTGCFVLILRLDEKEFELKVAFLLLKLKG